MAADLVAIALLTTSYFRRHGRRDMLLAYVGLNVGVLAVTTVLMDAAIGAGLGLGLFGVLSIIRLRSFELDQQEVAYYFVALALGVLGGVPVIPDWLAPSLMATLLVAIAIGDHPRLFGRYRNQTITLDQAHTDEPALLQRLEHMLGARVHRIAVRRVDLVNDTTLVDVRFELLDPDAATQRGDRGHELLGEGGPR
jgi:hypothetical protein